MTAKGSEEKGVREIRIILPETPILGVPEEAMRHARLALREWLLALRAILNAGIEFVERGPGTKPTKPRVKKVKVE